MPKNYYEVLGLASTATPEEIKRRYRELARRYHPDINRNADASDRFKEINEAYRTLSHAGRRATYDLELRYTARKIAEQAQQKTPSPQPKPAPQQPPTNRPHSQSVGEETIEQIVLQAQIAYSRGRLLQAAGLCRQALRLHRRNAAVYELLADIYRAQGKTDEAIAMLSYALQLNPSSPSVSAKFSRMTGHRSPIRSRPGSGGSFHSPSRSVFDRTSVRWVGRAFTIVICMFIVIISLLAANRAPTTPSEWIADTLPWLIGWNGWLVLCLSASGLASGALLTFAGWLAPIKETFWFTAGGSKKTGVPFAALILAASLIFFYGAALVYFIASVMQEAYSRSVALTMSAVLILIVLFALIYSPGSQVSLILFGGNILFPSLIMGWALGDGVRGAL